MFTPLLSKLLIPFLLATSASSATAQISIFSDPFGNSGNPFGNSNNNENSNRGNKVGEIKEFASLADKGIVGVKITNSLGGVVINESRGIALVLSSSPLVLVANPTLLNFDGKKLDTLESDLQQLLLIQTYIPVYDGMGMGMGEPSWVPNITQFSLNANDKQSGNFNGVTFYETFDLLFILDVTSHSMSGSSAPPAMYFQRAQLMVELES